VAAQNGRGEHDIGLGEQHRVGQDDEKETSGEPEALHQPLGARRADAGGEQHREQGADGDEAAGQHGQHQDLRHRQPLQPPGAVISHLGDDMLGAEILRGGADRAGRRALVI
jgi:hypothetical protein